MNAKSQFDLTVTFVPRGKLTSETKPLEVSSQIQRRAEDPEPLATTTAIRLREFFKTRVSWTQHILDSFKS